MLLISLALLLPLVFLLWGAATVLGALFSYGRFVFGAMALLSLAAMCGAAYLLRLFTVQGRFDAPGGSGTAPLFWHAVRTALIMALLGCIAAALLFAMAGSFFGF